MLFHFILLFAPAGACGGFEGVEKSQNKWSNERYIPQVKLFSMFFFYYDFSSCSAPLFFMYMFQSEASHSITISAFFFSP